MKNNLTARTVIIIVTILICVFGIIGFPKSGEDLVRNFRNNIRLGLDLKGGTHLVLEIQVQDAVKADADQTAEHLKVYAKGMGKPILASWMGGPEVAAGTDILNRAGIPTFPFPDTAAKGRCRRKNSVEAGWGRWVAG